MTTNYAVRRLFQTIVFIVLFTVAIYSALVYWMPGGPYQRYTGLLAAEILPPGLQTSSDLALVRQQAKHLTQAYKVDHPWPLSFLLWLYDPSETTRTDDRGEDIPTGINLQIGDFKITGAGILTGELGRSESNRLGREEVSSLIGARLGATLALIGATLVLSTVIAIPVGIIAAVRQRSAIERMLTFLSFSVLSLPPFVIGLVLMVLLAVVPKQLHDQMGWTWLPYLPVSDLFDTGQEGSWANHLYHMVLPVTTLVFIYSIWLSRHVRAAMSEVLRQDYIRTAWAKGLPLRRIVVGHGLRNALVSMSTVLGLLLPALVSGTIVVEVVFHYTGMGLLYFYAFGGCIDPAHDGFCPSAGFPPDYPLAIIMTILTVMVVAIANLGVDVAYSLVDPRIRHDHRGQA